MGGKNFIPGPDGEFDTFLKSFNDAVTGDPGGFGLGTADVTLIQATYSAWVLAFQNHKDTQLKAVQATATKEKCHDEAEAAVRSLVKKINGNPEVDNALRAKAALPPHDLVKTAASAPDTRPIGRLEAKGHYTLVLHFVDEMTPQQNAKPHGVHACEIRIFVGTAPPADESAYTFLAHDTRTPYTDVHPASDAGKTAYYMVRWLNTKLEPGPWGDVISAKIPL